MSINYLKKSTNPLAIVAEVELNYLSQVKAADRLKITSSRHAYEAFLQVYDLNKIEHREFFYVMYLNRANKVLGIMKLSEGGLTATVADIRFICQGALLANAALMIVCHNHPSGNLNPSEADKQLTNRIKNAGELLDIKLTDHLILVPHGGYYSFADEGTL